MNKPEASSTTLMQFPANALTTIIAIGHVNYTAPWIHFARTAVEYILYFVESGDLYIQEDDRKWHLGKNDALLLEPGKHHVGYQAAPVHYYYIHFTSSIPLTSCVMTDDIHEEIKDLHMGLLHTVFTYQWYPGPYDNAVLYFPKQFLAGGYYDYLRTLHEADQIFFEGLEGRRSLVSFRLQEMLIMAAREYALTCINPTTSRALALVRDIRLYLNRHYAEPISSPDIERQFHVNYDHANRLFKRYTRQTIHNYLMSVRITQAKDLLLAGTSVSGAASLVGFEDFAYFSRLFKKQTGLPPSEFSKNRVPIAEEG